MMPSHSSARKSSAAALLALAAAAVLSPVCFNQPLFAAQSAPDTTTNTTGGGDTASTTSPAPATGDQSSGDQSSGSAPTTAPTQPSETAKPAKPAESTEMHVLNERMDISDTHRVWHPTRRQLGFSVVAGSTDSGATQFKIDAEKLRAYLKSIAPYVRRAPQPAHVAIRAKTVKNPLATTSSSVPVPAKVFSATPGIALKIDESVEKIQKAIAADPTTTHIVLDIRKSPAPVTTSKLEGIDARIAHFVTRFNPHERGRTQTVRLAIAKINGHVVAPGQTFSVNQTVGERTKERGFGEGIVFVDGHLDKQLGGGMCQVATTLFNAVLLANLKIVERHQHVRTVPYVKPGQDATVYWGQKDFKFQNDTDAPVYIVYTTTASHAICDLYGKANPSIKVKIADDYHKLGKRHYTAVLKRYVTKNGETKADYIASSAYKWTPDLDYTM